MPQEARQIRCVSKYGKHAKALSISISQSDGEWDERDATVGKKRTPLFITEWKGYRSQIPGKSWRMNKGNRWLYINHEKKGGLRPEYWRECWVSGISGQQRCSGHLYSTGNRCSWLAQVDLRACWVCVCVCIHVCLRPVFQCQDWKDGCDYAINLTFEPLCHIKTQRIYKFEAHQ